MSVEGNTVTDSSPKGWRPRKTANGPLYMEPPVDGFYKWDCPACGCRQEDPEGMSDTQCSQGHDVTLAVVGTTGDGYRMVATLVEQIVARGLTR